MHLERLNRLLLAGGLLWPLVVGVPMARAEVVERVDYLRAADAVVSSPARDGRVAAGALAGWRGAPSAMRASTVWDIRWTLPTRFDADGRCAVGQPTIALTVAITLPAIAADGDEPAEPPPALQWRLDRLRRHEDGHLAIAEATARRVDAGLASIAPTADCAGLFRAAEQRARALIEQGSTEQAAYDALTDHGRHQEAAGRPPL